MGKKKNPGLVANDGNTALALLNNAAAQDRAAFVVMGGDLLSPTVYRSSLERVWKQSMSGNVSKSIRAEAYGISAAAYAATNYRAQVLSDTPVNIFFKNGQLADWNPVPYFLTSLPTLSWYIEATLIIYGVCYLRKVYNDYGYPAGLEWVHPDDVTPQTDIKGRVEEYYIDAVRYIPPQIVEIRTFDPQRTLDGKSEFEVALSRMTTEQSIVRHAGSFFFNSARPDGLLLSKTRLSKVDQLKAEQDWKKFKGSDNAWKTFVSSGQWEWIPLTGAPVDLAMVDLSTKNDRDILAIMRTNPALLGFADVSDPLSAGSTRQQIKRDHIEDVTIPRFNWILRHLNEQWLFPDFGHGDMYHLEVEKSKIPILSDVNLDRSQTAAALSGGVGVVADYKETRATMGLGEREVPYIARNPAELNTIWMNAGITLDEYREMIGLRGFGALYGGDLVRLPTGSMVRLSDLPKAAAAMLQGLIQQSLPPPPPMPPASNAPQFIMPPGGFGGMGGGSNIITPPAPSAPPALPANVASKTDLTKLARLVLKSSRSGGATNEAAVLLSFEGNRQIEAIQTILTAYGDPDQPSPEWTAPEDYHVTLIMADSLTPQAEQSIYETLGAMPPLDLLSGEIGTFPAGDDGKTPVVLFLSDNPGLKTLREYQAQLYAKIMEAEPGAVMSEYSLPDGWTPHITLAYAEGGFKPPPLRVPLPIIPTCLELSRKVYEITYSAPAPNGSEPPSPYPETVPAEPSQRAASRVTLAVSWPDNNFILMAQRVAANALQSAGVAGVEWYPPKNWTLELGGFSGTPGQANTVLNQFEPGDNPKIDLTAYAFQLSGNRVYLMCDPAETLSKLSASTRLQLEDAGVRAEETPFIPGIALGELTTDEPNALMDSYNALNGAADKLGMQLIASNVDLLVNGQTRNSWALRSFNATQKRELTDWRNKSTGTFRKDSKSFNTSALSGSLVESYVRAALAEIDPDDMAAVKDIFARAQRILTDGVNYLDLPDAPDEFDSYWSGFDSLNHNLGAAWLKYMNKAAPSILAMLATDTDPTSVLAPLNKFHDNLAAEWVGTPEEPGDLVKLVLAGMAAGNESLKSAVNMNPSERAFGGKTNNFSYTPPPQFTGIGVQVDWNLLNQEAYDFARQYSYKLIKGLDQTTQVKVQTVFGDWLKSGAAQPALKEALRGIFNDPTRADAIAETESITAYNEGAFKRWADVGVTKAVWRTVQDPKVCPICRPLNGQVADISAGWIHPGGNYIDPYDNQPINGNAFRGKVYRASAHTRCRCYRRPVVIYEKPGEPKIDPKTETVSKTRFAGVKIDEVLQQLDTEYADIRAAVEKKAAQLTDIKKRRDEMLAEKNALSTQMWDMRKTQPLRDSPEYEDYYKRYNEISKQFSEKYEAYKELEKNAVKQAAKTRKALTQELATPTAFRNTPEPLETKYSFQKKQIPSGAMMKKASESADFLQTVIDGDQYKDPVSYKVIRQPGRANYNMSGGLNMSPDSEVSVYVHETGHFIEDTYPDVHERCVEFLNYRAGSEQPKKMSELTGNTAYKAKEIAVKDNFEEPYIGKIYKNDKGEQYATEILSMGLQYMYEDAAGFAARDPEYFNFILGIMRRTT